MNEQKLFALIDSLTKGQGQMSKTPMGREALFMTDPNIGVGSPENIDIQELLRGMIDPKSPIRSQFSSALGRNKLQRDVGESKSIDDIINQSDMFEFLSKAMADKTNIDVSQMPMNPDRLRYSSDTIIDFLNSMGGYEMPTDEERRRTLPKRRKDLVKPKTKQG
tara:strand:+ start:11476 stop:11967 length:492 start_codon:yes stop_codon:yes gene_type:complete